MEKEREIMCESQSNTNKNYSILGLVQQIEWSNHIHVKVWEWYLSRGTTLIGTQWHNTNWHPVFNSSRRFLTSQTGIHIFPTGICILPAGFWQKKNQPKFVFSTFVSLMARIVGRQSCCTFCCRTLSWWYKSSSFTKKLFLFFCANNHTF